MKVRLLTDGGYGLRHDEMSKVYEAKKKNSCYIITIDGIEMYFYADEVEVVTEHIYFLDKGKSRAKLASLGIVILVTVICIAAIIYVIF
jgi:hypothetical protein